jgi:hypothetical protein
MKMKKTTVFLLTAVLAAVSTMFIGCPDPSIGDTTTLDTTPPAKVTALTATPGNAQVSLTWTDPTDSDFIGVEISISPAINRSPFTVDKGVETKEITSLTNGTAYTFTVKTKDDMGNKSSGVSDTATPITGIVAKPTYIHKGTVMKLNCATDGAVIFYSTDGTAPATVYTEAITFAGSKTFKAVAKKIGWRDSAVFKHELTATYSKYDVYKFANEAEFNAARTNHSLSAATLRDVGSVKPITYTEYIQLLKNIDANFHDLTYSKWDTTREPYIFLFVSYPYPVFDEYRVYILKN